MNFFLCAESFQPLDYLLLFLSFLGPVLLDKQILFIQSMTFYFYLKSNQSFNLDL